MLSDWNEGISTWRFNLYQDSWQGPYIAHAVLDRSLFRAGETVGMKLFMRRKAVNGFAFVDRDKLGKEIILQHEGTGDETRLPVKWDSQGIAEASVTLPREARQGRYSILVPHTLRGQETRIDAGSFRVAAYRVPTMRATLTGPSSRV